MKFMHFAIASAFAITPAFAHGGDHPVHGGQVVVVGETMFELVSKPSGAELYVVEDGDDVKAAGLTAKMTVDTAGKKAEVPLVAAGGNRFVATGAKLRKGAKVGVLIIDKQTEARQSAVFTVK
jgi:hypothetical protein